MFAGRRRRAARLRDDHPASADLLAFYLDLLDLQEPRFRDARRSGWLAAVAATDGAVPRLRLARLPERPRARAFVRFARDLPASAPELLRAAAARVAAEHDAAVELLRAFLERRPLDAVADTLDCDVALLGFLPLAFVQPIAEALAGTTGTTGTTGGDEPSAPADCPACGARPVVAVLRDEPEVKGRRTLLCSLCATEWVFPRTRCPGCDEQRPDRLAYHVSEAWPHVRVDACHACHTYLKTIDLRQNGRAVPVVDELASVALDLWASEQGMAKAQANVLGL